MVTEARNLPLVVGFDAPANPPEVRNLALVVGYDDPASIPPASGSSTGAGLAFGGLSVVG